MPMFRVQVTEYVIAVYKAIEVEAESEDAAKEVAEKMRCDGELHLGNEVVDEVEIELQG
jgi:phosphoribosylformylglycinamidine (FGAM) synthase PurS component